MLIDIHSHILPCDHGSDSVETSIRQLQLAKKYGIQTIVFTPHYDHRAESVDTFLQRREAALQSLTLHPDFPSEIRFVTGAEVSMEPGIEKCADLEKLAIDGGKFILLEFSKFLHGSWAFEALYDIEARGLKPIIAHVHRYDPDTVDYVLRSDFYCQVNASTIESKKDWERVKEWIAEHRVHFLGSDIHGAVESYYKNFVKLCKKIPKKELQRLMGNAAAILS